MTATANPVADNSEGLECFAAGNPAAAEELLRKAFLGIPNELGILVNLGLALMQQGKVDQAERCYRIALRSDELRVRRSAAKNLGFLLLWRGEQQQGWHWHGRRFEGESFQASQWRGDPLNGQTLTVWNDVGMGDAFQFVRYTLPLLQRGERVRFAVAASQIDLFRNQLAWELTEVVDRRSVDHLHGGPQIPLMSLSPLLDSNTLWGRRFAEPTWRPAQISDEAKRHVGLCWASNPQDRTMHAYKSCTPERLIELQRTSLERYTPISLQTDEVDAHQRMKMHGPQADWNDTLKRIAKCSSVISVDTAVAHLSAGSEVPTMLVLSNPPDWRWRPVAEDPQAPLWYQSLYVGSEPLKSSPHL